MKLNFVKILEIILVFIEILIKILLFTNENVIFNKFVGTYMGRSCSYMEEIYTVGYKTQTFYFSKGVYSFMLSTVYIYIGSRKNIFTKKNK